MCVSRVHNEEMVLFERDSPKLNCCCAIALRKGCGPSFFGETTVIGISYLDAVQL